jgi:copper chaperone CopZ
MIGCMTARGILPKSLSAIAVAAALSAALAAERQSAQVSFRIEGMTCDGCASAVEVQLQQTEGVTAYQVSFEDAEARVTYDPARTTPRKIAASIGVTGFRAFVKQPPKLPELTVLASLSPLAADFNAADGAPRFLAILSPTCSACLHGAEAVREALLGDAAAPRLQVFVVWAPMLSSDDEAAARSSSALVKHARVRQYYDAGRLAGTAFRRQVFPKAVETMRASLPAGHFLAAPFAARDPEQPEWDIYLFFGPQAAWGAQAPRPERFLRQVVLRSGGAGAPAGVASRSSVFWKNDYAKAPLEGSLFEHLRAEAEALGAR